jgi:hypothetical protein
MPDADADKIVVITIGAEFFSGNNPDSPGVAQCLREDIAGK